MTRRAWLPLAVTAVLACAPGERPVAPGPERERATLTAAEVDAIAVLLRYEDHREFDGDAFRRLAGHGGTEVRRRTAVAAGRIGDVAAVPLLIDMLARDASPAVRADAAFALGLVGDTSAVVIEALRAAAPREWAPVRPQETTVVVEVVAALGRLGSSRARAEVVDALRRVHAAADPHSRRIAAEGLLAIWRFPAGPARTTSATRFLDHPDAELRWRAALALVRLELPDATASLVARAEDSDPRVRAMVMRGIAAPLADSAGITGTALAALATALDDPHPHVRINAVRALGTFADRAPTDGLVRLLRDVDPNVASAAAGALATQGGAGADPLAGFLADQDAPVGPRAAALAALAAVDPGAAAPVVAEWAGGDLERRYAAARAIGALGWAHGRAPLERLATDADVRVAIAATQAAATLAGDTALDSTVRTGLRDLLFRAASADDPRQRAPALRGLAPILEPDDLDALLAAYERAADDLGSRAAAIAAIRAIAELDEASPGAAAEFFRRFPASHDRWIARAAADALGPGWGAPPPAAAADDTTFYREIVNRYVVPALAGGPRPVASIGTPHGDIRIELIAEEAPLTVHNFAALAEAGFYDDGVWHRVVPNFVLQDGAPAGDPAGGPGSTIRDEINRVRYERGVMGMALSGPDTGGSQWFITHSPQPHLDGGYTVFGRVVAGERAMDRVVQGEPVVTVRVTH